MSHTKTYTLTQRVFSLEKQVRELQMTIIGMHNIMKRKGMLDASNNNVN